MKPESIIVVYKRSRFERDRERYACSDGELIRAYRNWGLTPERIHESDERQREARTKLTHLLPGATFISGEQLTRAAVAQAAVVVALGGDNHFQRVARLLDNQLIVGVNSDPETSAGALTRFTVVTFQRALHALLGGRLPVEDWLRLSVSVNRKRLPELALGEVFVGERDRCAMSRHVLYFDDVREEQKSSGLLAVTGAGSTGWLASASGLLRKGRMPLRPSEHRFCYLVTEPHGSVQHRAGILSEKPLRVVSLNRRHGIVCLDAFRPYRAGMGAVIEIARGPALRVAGLRLEQGAR